MDRKNLFPIGEVSKLFHISVSSLRHYEKLLDYIKKEQIQIVGFSREITLIDYGITNDSEKFVTEICIPVKSR